jgi:8-oxo-dGTP pyrophosphatase MutT (NUDIX family)
MKLDYKTLADRLKQPLPGPIAHEPLRAVSVGTIRPKFEHKLPPRPGSVLILLYQEGDQIKFPLTIRPDYLGTHGGQISFPGGKAEEGEDEIETALREGEEEIGIIRNEIKVLGSLSEFFVIPSNFMVTPVVAFAERRPAFVADPVEVVRIIEGNLDDLVKEDAVRTKEILAAKLYPMMAPHFEIEGEIVWGATAMMLNEFRLVIKSLEAGH